MKVNGTAFTVYSLLQWSFLNVKMHLFRDKFDVCIELKDAIMYLVLLYCFLQNSVVGFFYTKMRRHLDEHCILAAIWHLLAFSFYFSMEKILFLYSFGNQHSADLPFHMMPYWCCLQLPQFAAHVVWINSVTFAKFHCILYSKSPLVC